MSGLMRMVMLDISKQFNNCMNNAFKDMYYDIIPQMVQFGIKMVTDILPNQADYRNLTGNTFTSYAFGVYYMGKIDTMGFNNKSEPALCNKLMKGDVLMDFEDYDGNWREMFIAKINTDGKLGRNTSLQFLQNYRCLRQYGIVFTTGTEYSEYLENVRKLNVLTKAVDTSKTAFIKSFKPIK